MLTETAQVVIFLFSLLIYIVLRPKGIHGLGLLANVSIKC